MKWCKSIFLLSAFCFHFVIAKASTLMQYDVKHYNITLDFDLAKESIRGSVDMRFNVLKKGENMKLLLHKALKVDSVKSDGRNLFYSHHDDQILLKAKGFKKGSQKVTVYYHGSPQAAVHPPWSGGVVWSKDEQGNHLVGVACELEGASLWWPNKGELADRPDSVNMIYTVPREYKAIGNGRLMNEKTVGSKKQFEWKVSYPIAPYNLTFYIGKYELISDVYVSKSNVADTLDLSYYVLPKKMEKAMIHFQQVAPMLSVYQQYFGKYPFWKDGFKLIEAAYLGMEHQSAIAYGNKFRKGYMGKYPGKLDFDYVIVHEAGHEYWGNSLGMSKMCDLWINEAFCTYTELLFVEATYGKKYVPQYLAYLTQKIFNDKEIVPDCSERKMGSSDMYVKGAAVLHLIRQELDNDSLWFSGLRAMLKEHSYQTISTEAMKSLVRKKFGVEAYHILEHYLHYAYVPILHVEKVGKRKFKIWLETPVKALNMNVILKGKREKTFRVGTTVKEIKFKLKRGKKPQLVSPLHLLQLHYE